jgi:hypothetical protein
MAHEVRLKFDSSMVLHKDIQVVVRTSAEGKVGTLLISKGNVEWVPKGNSINRRRLSWWQFAKMMEAKGKRIKKS